MLDKKDKKDKINKKLYNIGWEIPQGIKFNGIRENHAVRCLYCGNVTIKRLDNLLYRKEECNACGTGDIAVKDIVLNVKDNVKLLINTIKEIASRTNDKTESIHTIFRRYIAKSGVIQFGRKVTKEEWAVLSHILALEIIEEIATNKQIAKIWKNEYEQMKQENVQRQGQDILLEVVPAVFHEKIRDRITIRAVKL